MAKRAKLNRTLISLQSWDGITLHGYLMCERPNHDDMVGQAIEQMAAAADRIGLRHMNVWLSTGPLPAPQQDIEAIIRKHCPDGAKTIDAFKGGKFVSFICWGMATDTADNETLMAVH